ncbi:MAG TPA: hypothetical protein VFZ52_08750 [Chryseolinea sp.]
MRVFVGISLSLMLLSCDDEKQIEPPWDNFSVEVNSIRWEGATQIHHYFNSNDSLAILGIIPEPEGLIELGIKFQGAGEYPLTGINCAYHATIGHDARIGEYRFDPNNLGKLVITEYEPKTKFIRGTFEVELKKVFANPDTVPDILIFREGKFEGKIQED